MITFQRLARYVGAEPFRPFLITLAGGRAFEIRHPEMISIGRTTATIFTFLSENPDDAREREVEVSLMLTESVEPLEAKSAASDSSSS